VPKNKQKTPPFMPVRTEDLNELRQNKRYALLNPHPNIVQRVAFA
jgi:hypothetical protein